MDEGDGGGQADLGELRLRLYRRDPPPDAAERYLAALAAVPVPRARTPVPRRRRPRLPLRALAGAAAGLVGCVAFAAALPAGSHLLTIGTAVPAARPPAPEPIPPPPATGTALGTMAGGPRASARFAAAGHVVTVSVLCAGSGTISLRLGTEPPTVLTCDTALPAFAMLQSAAALDRFTIEVVPDRTARWSLEVGALRPPTPPPAPAGRQRST